MSLGFLIAVGMAAIGCIGILLWIGQELYFGIGPRR